MASAIQLYNILAIGPQSADTLAVFENSNKIQKLHMREPCLRILKMNKMLQDQLNK